MFQIFVFPRVFSLNQCELMKISGNWCWFIFIPELMSEKLTVVKNYFIPITLLSNLAVSNHGLWVISKTINNGRISCCKNLTIDIGKNNYLDISLILINSDK